MRLGAANAWAGSAGGLPRLKFRITISLSPLLCLYRLVFLSDLLLALLCLALFSLVWLGETKLGNVENKV